MCLVKSSWFLYEKVVKTLKGEILEKLKRKRYRKVKNLLKRNLKRKSQKYNNGNLLTFLEISTPFSKLSDEPYLVPDFSFKIKSFFWLARAQ